MQDREEFRQFADSNSEALLRAARLLCGDWFAAEDLVQSTLLAAWREWAKVAAADAPVAYVRRMLLRAFLQGRRRRWVGEIPMGELPERPDDTDGYEATETYVLVERALRRLPPRQRAVIVLRFFADLTASETAATLDVSVGAVKSHTAKAMANLRTSPGLADVLADHQELC